VKRNAVILTALRRLALRLTGEEMMQKKIFAVFAVVLFFGSFNNSPAQPRMLAKLNFNPTIDGFYFKNYPNIGDRWQDDLAADDLIRMFGRKEVCKDKAANKCAMEAGARLWMKEKLEAMNIGHCEGIAAISLRMKTGLAFKKLTSPASFQPGAKSPFDLRLEQPLENYIAYYWITQTFREVKKQTAQTVAGRRNPVDIVKTLIDSMNGGRDTYLIRLWKHGKDNYFEDGHSITPFAVADDAERYIVYVYDNNHPGETRYLYVNKNGSQQWTYNSTANKQAAPDYVGYASTKSLQLTATSWRDNRCFDPPFAKDEAIETGCGIETARLDRPFFANVSFRPPMFAGDADGEDAEFFLTGEGNMLVTDGDGRRIGYDSNNRFYDEISGGDFNLLIGGLGIDAPLYYVPYEDSGEPYTIEFSGKNLKTESVFDFVFSAPGFTVGFDGIRLDPNETLKATVSRDGEEITFTTSATDGETPEVFFAFDPEDDSDASYITEIGGVALTARKRLTYNFDFENLKLYFSDDDGNEDAYDIELIRINADGSEDVYQQKDLNIGKADRYQMDFGDWDGGEDTMCFKDDEDGDGFDDETCDEQANEADEN
jgi:hypothetical protein